MIRFSQVFIVTLLLVGCRDEEPSVAPQARADDIDCSSLTRTHCMESPECTLEAMPDDTTRNPEYVCRPAVGPCETNVTQAQLSGADSKVGSQRAIVECNGMGTCQAEPGECFCPCHGHGQTEVPDGHEAPPCQCKCSGGPPPVCSPAPLPE